MMKKKLFCLIFSAALLFSCAAPAEGTLPDFGFYDPLIMQSLTWTEGTGIYDYVLFNYENTDTPFEGYTVSAALPAMTPALHLASGRRFIDIVPYIMASEDIAVPALSVSVSDTAAFISTVRIKTESLSLFLDFSGSPESLSRSTEDRTTYARAVNIGSNLFTLIGDLADNGAFVACEVILNDGTSLSAASDRISREEDNPFRWLDRCLKESRLIDESRRMQESLRLYTAQFILHFSELPEITLSGARWIDDLADSVSAYPMKLEYAEEDKSAAFTVGVLNYSGTFGDRSGRSSLSVGLCYYCLDEDGAVLPFADGSVLRHWDSVCALSSGESRILPVSVPLPKGTASVMAAISSVAWSEGAVRTVPDRDLVFVEYEVSPAYTVESPEESPVEDSPVSL